jgi:alcohol dehydrogenase class IV
MKKLTALFAALALTVVMIACGGGSNFDPAKVTEGMTEAEVKTAVGEPTMSMTIMDKTVLTYGQYGVTIEEGKVTSVEKVE